MPLISSSEAVSCSRSGARCSRTGTAARGRGVQMRGRTDRRTSLLAAGALLLAGLAPALALGAAVAPAHAAATDPVTLTIGVTNDADSLNPFVGIEAMSFELWQLEYDYLVTYSPKDLSPVPALAQTWDTSDDGLTWTFHMTDKA